MNERLKELMAKAMVKSPDMSRPGRKELDPEKFAELIVRECDNQILKYQYRVHASEEHLVLERLEQLRTIIKEHFGDEE